MFLRAALVAAAVGQAAGFGFSAPLLKGERSAAVSSRSASLAAPKMGLAVTGNTNLDKNLDHIFRNNKRWVNEQTRDDPKFFDRMKEGQAPKFLWIGCSDARVPANEIVGCGPGELFVHRNIANLVVNNDNSIQSVFQFSVEYLQVEHIIICGHYQCGGVLASMENTDLASPLEEWVRNIRDVYRLHKEELDAISDIPQRQRRMVELNAQEQALNVYKSAVVQRRRVYTHLREGFATPKVHAVVFDIATGELKELDWEADKDLKALKDQYDLYSVNDQTASWADSEYPKRPNSMKALFNRSPPGVK